MLKSIDVVDSGFVGSVRGFKWEEARYDERLYEALLQRFPELPEIVSRLLSGIGIEPENVENYLNPSIRNFLPDPFCLMDMEIAANRISDAVINGEKIGIFGDYDVDGATSSAVLKKFFNMLSASSEIHIPDRITEGYGPNIKALLALKERGANVVITVDCGTVAFEPIAEATKAGIDMIIIDHHIGEAEKPNALAIVNPNRFDETSEHGQLAACGVAFLLAVAVSNKLRAKGWFKNHKEPNLLDLLDLVALGSVCDVVSLTGINRAYVAQGLKVIAARRNVGLSALIDRVGIDIKPSVFHLGFVIGPRINAGGRVGESSLGARLLSCDNPDEAVEIAAKLDQFNSERKTLEALVLEEATTQIEAMGNNLPPIIFLHSDTWHPGVVGIVASRMKDLYHRPVAVISVNNGVGKASCRSITGVNFGNIVSMAKDRGLLLAGGGHAMAAGFSLDMSRIDEVHAFMCDRVGDDFEELSSTRKLIYSGVLSVSGVSVENGHAIEKLGPFGAGNPQPRFVFHKFRISYAELVSGTHVKCIFSDPEVSTSKPRRIRGMAFRSADTELGNFLLSSIGKTVNLIGMLNINQWQGNETAELIIEDAALCE